MQVYQVLGRVQALLLTQKIALGQRAEDDAKQVIKYNNHLQTKYTCNLFKFFLLLDQIYLNIIKCTFKCNVISTMAFDSFNKKHTSV